MKAALVIAATLATFALVADNEKNNPINTPAPVILSGTKIKSKDRLTVYHPTATEFSVLIEWQDEDKTYTQTALIVKEETKSIKGEFGMFYVSTKYRGDTNWISVAATGSTNWSNRIEATP